MNGKFIGVVIGAVVAIMLVGSLVVPIIDDVSTTEGPVLKDGAFPCLFDYKTDNYGQRTINFKLADGADSVVITEGNNTYVVPCADDEFIFMSATGTAPIDLCGVRISTYEGGYALYNYYRYGGTRSAGELTVTINDSNVTVTGTTAGGSQINTQYTAIWMVIPNESGDYALWLNEIQDDAVLIRQYGNNAGNDYYLAPAYTQAVITNNQFAVMFAIPIVLLASLLVAVAAMAFKRDY